MGGQDVLRAFLTLKTDNDRTASQENNNEEKRNTKAQRIQKQTNIK